SRGLLNVSPGCGPGALHVEGTNISFICSSGRGAGQSDVVDVRGCRIARSALSCISTRETSPDLVPGPPMAKRPDVHVWFDFFVRELAAGRSALRFADHLGLPVWVKIYDGVLPSTDRARAVRTPCTDTPSSSLTQETCA